ncbi:MAG: hypothetical protein SFT81_08160 [Candidatus Caenarcaniphilales bacterium]|nr:hypothetical protein [Candidatus Caenarcaniphilales bacterium]
MSITLKQASMDFMDWMRESGKAERSLYNYGKDLEQIQAYFGEDKLLDKILIPHVSGFLKSVQLLMKKSKDGTIPRAKPTIDKTIRIFKMLMNWAKDKGYISKLTLPGEIKTQNQYQNTLPGFICSQWII